MLIFIFTGHIEDEELERARYLRSCTAANASAAAATYHSHELHPGYDPMADATEFDRYQQRPVDLGYNNR